MLRSRGLWDEPEPEPEPDDEGEAPLQPEVRQE
jgi:peptidyl-dipeptidase Dcp